MDPTWGTSLINPRLNRRDQSSKHVFSRIWKVPGSLSKRWFRSLGLLGWFGGGVGGLFRMFFHITCGNLGEVPQNAEKKHVEKRSEGINLSKVYQQIQCQMVFFPMVSLEFFGTTVVFFFPRQVWRHRCGGAKRPNSLVLEPWHI